MAFDPAPQTLDYRPKLNRIRRPDNPKQWKYRLLAGTPDRTIARSLEKFAPPIKDQENEGSCTAHGGTSAAETCAAIAGITVVPLCRNELYYDERIDDNDFPEDAGASVSDSIDSQLKRNGLGPESQWPYDAQPAEKPPAGYPKQRYLYVKAHQPLDLSSRDAAINGFLTACDNKQPLVIGLDWYEEFFDQFKATGVLAATPKTQIAGGHEIFSACFYVPPNPAHPVTGKYGLAGFDNSWGLTSPARTDIHPDARAGMVFIPMEALGGYVNEVRAVVGAAAPTPTPVPVPTPVPTDCKAQAQAIADPLVIAAVTAANAYITSGGQATDKQYWRIFGHYEGNAESDTALGALTADGVQRFLPVPNVEPQ